MFASASRHTCINKKKPVPIALKIIEEAKLNVYPPSIASYIKLKCTHFNYKLKAPPWM